MTMPSRLADGNGRPSTKSARWATATVRGNDSVILRDGRLKRPTTVAIEDVDRGAGAEELGQGEREGSLHPEVGPHRRGRSTFGSGTPARSSRTWSAWSNSQDAGVGLGPRLSLQRTLAGRGAPDVLVRRRA